MVVSAWAIRHLCPIATRGNFNDAGHAIGPGSPSCKLAAMADTLRDKSDAGPFSHAVSVQLAGFAAGSAVATCTPLARKAISRLASIWAMPVRTAAL